jgi:hypothetical protein
MTQAEVAAPYVFKFMSLLCYVSLVYQAVRFAVNTYYSTQNKGRPVRKRLANLTAICEPNVSTSHNPMGPHGL